MNPSTSEMTRTFEHSTEWLKDKPTIKKRLAGGLNYDHRHKRSHLKVIANHAGASPRTAASWTEGLSLPALEYFLRLIPHSPSIQKMLLQLMTLDADQDPEHARVLSELRRLRL